MTDTDKSRMRMETVLSLARSTTAAFHHSSIPDNDHWCAGDGITSVIWTSGYRPAYDWVHFPVLDDMGFPVQTDGRSSVRGLYFMGVHFQRRARSAVLYGVGEDAEVVAQHIVDNRS